MTTIPGYTNYIKVETDFVVAETVLVGKVPDSYTEVDGSQASCLEKYSPTAVIPSRNSLEVLVY